MYWLVGHDNSQCIHNLVRELISGANICFWDHVGVVWLWARLVVLAHEFDVGHFWVVAAKKCQKVRHLDITRHQMSMWYILTK